LETFEIRDEEIDVEEIMRRIRENIRQRKEAGIYPEGEIEEVHSAGQDQNEGAEATLLSPEGRRDLDYINSNWNVENKGYFVSSHRPVAGKFLVTGRQLVHGEVRRYVDPAIWKQKEFNASMVRLLNETARRLEQISAKITNLENSLKEVRSEISLHENDDRIGQAKSEILGAIEAEISQTKSEIEAGMAQLDAGIEERIEAKVGQARSEIEAGMAQLDAGIEERIEAKVGQARSEIEAGIAKLDSGIEERIEAEIDQTKSEIEAGIAQLDAGIEKSVRSEANAVISAMNQDIQNKAWLASILEGRLGDYENVPLSSDLHSDYEGINYFVFEEMFRGSREEIKKRQSAFIQYFDKSGNVLDIGCGRGEFLELLKERGICARGIDVNKDMVDYCKSRGLDVEMVDAVTYLEKIEEKSLDGVFVDQVVEHLQSDYLVKMLGLCYKKLKYGHFIVVETVNPISFYSLANFYMDLTHVRPVHPATLRFLLGSVGFREIEVRFFSPVPDEERLKRVELEGEKKELMRRFAEIYDQNVDMINSVLYGAQDYAIIGKK